MKGNRFCSFFRILKTLSTVIDHATWEQFCKLLCWYIQKNVFGIFCYLGCCCLKLCENWEKLTDTLAWSQSSVRIQNGEAKLAI